MNLVEYYKNKLNEAVNARYNRTPLPSKTSTPRGPKKPGRTKSTLTPKDRVNRLDARIKSLTPRMNFGDLKYAADHIEWKGDVDLNNPQHAYDAYSNEMVNRADIATAERKKAQRLAADKKYEEIEALLKRFKG